MVLLAFVGIAAEARAQSSLAPWTAQDIGNPSIPGSTSFAGNVFTVNSSGWDIWDTSDQFHFVYQQVSGDVEIVARVDDLTQADPWSEAGVMIRGSLAPGSAHGFAFLAAAAANGVRFEPRAVDGGTTADTLGGSAAAPYWVRLVRVGTQVTASMSSDGSTWKTIGSSSVALNASAYIGLAVTSHNASTLATAHFSQVKITPLGLPPPQQAQNIGSPAISGNVSFKNGTYTINAGGADIGGVSDQFYFVYQPLAGDADVVLRMASLKGSRSWTKAGVMIRETLTPDSAHASALVSVSRGYAFLRRVAPGATSDLGAGGAGAAPGWLRLVRTGSRFDAYRSADGQSWTSMGTVNIPMANTVYVGIAATARSTTAPATAVVDNFTITQSAKTNQPPVVSLTAPASGATYTAPASIGLSANASDPEGQMGRVEFYANTTLIGTATTAPYSMTWSSVPAGTYQLTAVAFDAAGASTTSSAVSVTVNGANQPPTVTLTAPVNGATATAPATITLAASASDPDGTVARVDFYNGTTLLGSATAAPYGFTWSSVPAGTYTLTAAATDNTGARTTSAGVTVTVNAAAPPPPPPPPPPPTGPPRAVVFHASADHNTLVTSYKLEIFAAGADPNTATPISSANLGKPTPDVNGDITSDQSALFSALAAGNYLATVSAIGTGGSSRSAAITFTR